MHFLSHTGRKWRGSAGACRSTLAHHSKWTQQTESNLYGSRLADVQSVYKDCTSLDDSVHPQRKHKKVVQMKYTYDLQCTECIAKTDYVNICISNKHTRDGINEIINV